MAPSLQLRLLVRLFRTFRQTCLPSCRWVRGCPAWYTPWPTARRVSRCDVEEEEAWCNNDGRKGTPRG
eukprot:8268957-Alexandrium_andersonii.AAC.1